MPALNIIATHEIVRNSGCSPSRPSGMLPYRLTASHSTNVTNALEVRTNSQPVFVMTQSSALVEAVLRELVLEMPQIMKATATAALTPNTILSRPPPSTASGTGTSRAGCGIGSLTGVLNASSTAWRTASRAVLSPDRCGVSGVVVMPWVPSGTACPGVFRL